MTNPMRWKQRRAWMTVCLSGVVLGVLVAAGGPAHAVGSCDACGPSSPCNRICIADDGEWTNCGAVGAECHDTCQPRDEYVDETQFINEQLAWTACTSAGAINQFFLTERTIHKVIHHVCPYGDVEEVIGIQDAQKACWYPAVPGTSCTFGHGSLRGAQCIY